MLTGGCEVSFSTVVVRVTVIASRRYRLHGVLECRRNPIGTGICNERDFMMTEGRNR
jgi:hypothetical protein